MHSFDGLIMNKLNKLGHLFLNEDLPIDSDWRKGDMMFSQFGTQVNSTRI